MQSGYNEVEGIWNFSYFIFQGFSFLHLIIILLFEKLCYTLDGKLYFSATIILC